MRRGGAPRGAGMKVCIDRLSHVSEQYPVWDVEPSHNDRWPSICCSNADQQPTRFHN